MTQQSAENRLFEIHKRAERATPGVWTWADDEMTAPMDPSYEAPDLSMYAGKGNRIIETDSGVYPPREADRDFIAHAREDIPWLVNLALCELLRRAGPSPEKGAVMDPRATAGRIVNFHLRKVVEAHPQLIAIAAIVNRDTLDDGTAELTIFHPSGPEVRGVKYSENPAPNCWSWMPYQKEKAKQPGGNQSESAEPRPVDASGPEPLPHGDVTPDQPTDAF